MPTEGIVPILQRDGVIQGDGDGNMASVIHETIKKELKSYFRKLEKENDRPFPTIELIDGMKINDPCPGSKDVLNYQPDCCVRRNISRNSHYLIVFEILDSQEDIKAMADIARILSTREIKKAIFISCSKEKKKETDNTISCLIGSYKSRFRKKKKGDIMDIISREISKLEVVKKSVKELVEKELMNYIPKHK